MNQDTPTSSGLIIGVILGILILGGIFLYMRGNNNTAPADNKSSLDINVTLPEGMNGGNNEPAQ